jgi:N utilization substance protein A
MVTLPGLKDLIENISRERNLPRIAVQSAIREALLKGYERYRRAQNLERKQFDEDYFDNFDVQLDVDDEGFRVVATKTIVEKSPTLTMKLLCNKFRTWEETKPN